MKSNDNSNVTNANNSSVKEDSPHYRDEYDSEDDSTLQAVLKQSEKEFEALSFWSSMSFEDQMTAAIEMSQSATNTDTNNNTNSSMNSNTNNKSTDNVVNNRDSFIDNSDTNTNVDTFEFNSKYDISNGDDNCNDAKTIIHNCFKCFGVVYLSKRQAIVFCDQCTNKM